MSLIRSRPPIFYRRLRSLTLRQRLPLLLDIVDPQPTLVELLVRHVLLPREQLPQIEINSNLMRTTASSEHYMDSTTRRYAPYSESQLPLPGLADQIVAKAVVRLLMYEAKAGFLIDAAGGQQHTVGPQGNCLVVRLAREAHACIY